MWGTDLTPAPWHLPHRRARWHRRADDANAPVCAAGATTPEPDPGVEGREEGLDLPGGQIGVRLLCGEVGVCWGREEWSGSVRRADRREIVVCGRGECVERREERAGFARRANRREFVDWCEVWR